MLWAKADVARFRRFVVGIGQRAGDGFGQIEPVFAHDGAGVFKRGRIRHRRPRTDHRRVVAGHVGNGERDQLRRKSAAGEAAAFDAGQMLTHAIDLADIGAAAQQRPRRRLLVAERDARGRRDQIGRGAAGQERQHQVVGARRVGQRQHALGAGEPGRIRYRMAGFDHRDVPRRPPIAVAGDGNAVEPARRHARQIMLFGDLGERARRLAGGKHDRAGRAPAVRAVAAAGSAKAARRRPPSGTMFRAIHAMARPRGPCFCR